MLWRHEPQAAPWGNELGVLNQALCVPVCQPGVSNPSKNSAQRGYRHAEPACGAQSPPAALQGGFGGCLSGIPCTPPPLQHFIYPAGQPASGFKDGTGGDGSKRGNSTSASAPSPIALVLPWPISPAGGCGLRVDGGSWGARGEGTRRKGMRLVRGELVGDGGISCVCNITGHVGDWAHPGTRRAAS